MKKISSFLYFCLFILIGCSAPSVAVSEPIIITDYTLESKTRVSRTVFDYSYKGSITNTESVEMTDITATATSNHPGITIIKTSVSFPDIAAGDTAKSSDTFIIRKDRNVIFDQKSIIWNIDYNNINTSLKMETVFKSLPYSIDEGLEEILEANLIKEEGSQHLFFKKNKKVKFLKNDNLNFINSELGDNIKLYIDGSEFSGEVVKSSITPSEVDGINESFYHIEIKLNDRDYIYIIGWNETVEGKYEFEFNIKSHNFKDGKRIILNETIGYYFSYNDYVDFLQKDLNMTFE